MRPLIAAAAASVLLAAGACQPATDAPSAEAVIDSAIAAHGGPTLNRAVVTFDFRGDDYWVRQGEEQFHYRRTYTDSLGQTVTEGITNDDVYRVVAGDTVDLSSPEQDAVHSTVNSVVYFALLPEPLGDPAVQPSYSGRDTIDGVPYHRLRVTFRQEGGGEDWEDVFTYWFRTDTYAMDYLAYAFGLGPNEEPGTRFREAYNVRRVDGVRFADYYNYTADPLGPEQLHRYPSLWAQDSLELVSRVELDSISVRPLPEES